MNLQEHAHSPLPSRRDIFRFFTFTCLSSGIILNNTPSYAVENVGISIERWKELDEAATGEVAGFIINKNPIQIPELNYQDRFGNNISSKTWAGKYIFLNIWASWCPPCRYEMPSIQHLHTQFGSDKFTVIPVSIDKGDITVPMEFYSEYKLNNLPLYHDSSGQVFNEFRRLGRAKGLPYTTIIDPNGFEIGHMNGPAAWHSQDAIKFIETVIKT